MRKKMIASLVIIGIFLGGILGYKRIYLNYYNHKIVVVESERGVSSSAVKPSGVTRLMANKSLIKVNRTLEKQGFNGMYIRTDGTKISASKGFGLSDSQRNSNFDYNTTMRIGSLETIINAAVLLHEVDNNKITKKTDLRQYVPELKLKKVLTLSSLMSYSTGLSIKKDFLSNRQSSTAINSYFKNVSYNGGTDENEKIANDMLVAILISRIEKKSYGQVMDSVGKRLNLNSLTILNGRNGGTQHDRNVSTGYHYKADDNGDPDLSDAYGNVDKRYTYGIDQIRMSLLDFVNVYYALNHEIQITTSQRKNYADFFAANSNFSQHSGQYLRADKFEFHSHGYEISGVLANNRKSMTIVYENFPNKGLSGISLATAINKIK